MDVYSFDGTIYEILNWRDVHVLISVASWLVKFWVEIDANLLQRRFVKGQLPKQMFNNSLTISSGMESSMHNLPRISHNSQLRFRQDYLRGSDDIHVLISVASCSFESRKITIYFKGDLLRVNFQSKSLTLDNSLSSSSGMKSSLTVQFSDFNVWGDEKLQGWREIARSIVSSLNTLSDKHTRALIIRTKTVICHIVNWLIDDLLFNLQRKSSTTDNQAPVFTRYTIFWLQCFHRTLFYEGFRVESCKVGVKITKSWYPS